LGIKYNLQNQVTAEHKLVPFVINSTDGTLNELLGVQVDRVTRYYREFSGQAERFYNEGDPATLASELSLALQNPLITGDLREQAAMLFKNVLDVYFLIAVDPRTACVVLEKGVQKITNGSFPNDILRLMVNDKFEECLAGQEGQALAFMLFPNHLSETGLNLVTVYVPKDLLDLT